MPQIRFALSRGIAVGGLFSGIDTWGGALPVALAPGYNGLPLQGFQFGASPALRNYSSGLSDTVKRIKKTC